MTVSLGLKFGGTSPVYPVDTPLLRANDAGCGWDMCSSCLSVFLCRCEGVLSSWCGVRMPSRWRRGLVWACSAALSTKQRPTHRWSDAARPYEVSGRFRRRQLRRTASSRDSVEVVVWRTTKLRRRRQRRQNDTVIMSSRAIYRRGRLLRTRYGENVSSSALLGLQMSNAVRLLNYFTLLFWPVAYYYSHGRKSRSRGERVPQNLEWGTLMQIVPHILSCFKISSTRLLALQCNKKLANSMTLTEYSHSPNVHFQRPPNHHFRRKIQHFSGEDTDKT